MLPVAVPRAVLSINGRSLIGRVVLRVFVVGVFAKHVGCIPQFVLSVERRRRCHLSHEMTDLSIAAIVTSREVLVERVIAERAGNLHE